MVRRLPGIYHIDNYDNDLLGIRGVLGAGNGDIVLLVNGALQHTNLQKYLALPPESIDRVEFIRGPMSVIYGNGAFLGAINVVTNDIQPDQPQFTLGNSRGGINSYRFGVRWGKSNNDGNYIGNIYGESSEGIDAKYQDMMSEMELASIPAGAHLSTANNLERENWGGLLTGEWKDFYGQIHYQHIEREAWILTTSFDEGNREDVDQLSAELGLRSSISKDLELNTKLNMGKFEVHRDYDFIVRDLEGDRTIKFQRYEAELNLLYKPHSHLDLLFGFNYLRLKDGYYKLVIPLLNLDENINNSNIETYSIFIQSSYHYLNKFEFILGARIEQEKSYFKKVGGNGNLTTLTLGTHEVNPMEHSFLVPRAAMIYNIKNNHIVKLMYGEATKSSASIASTIATHELREEIRTFEINYLYSEENQLLSFSIFNNENKNLGRHFQFFTEEDGFQSIGTFSGELETYGAEMWGKVNILDFLSLDLSATYVDLKDKDTTAAVGSSPNFLYKVKTSYIRRPYFYTISARYRASLFADWNLINLDGSVDRVGERVDSSLVIDTNIRYESPSNQFNVNFKIANIMNDRVHYPASENASFERGLLGPGRSFLVTFNYFLN